MNTRPDHPVTSMTRRGLLQGSAALAAGFALGAAPLRGARVHGAPTTFATYADASAITDVATLQARLGYADPVVVAFMPVEDFEAGHIPGAVQIDAPELEVIDTSDASISVWHGVVGELLGGLGIAPDSDVVAYDAGTLFAARLWWILRYLGHGNVALLNGGLAAWQAAGGDIETGAIAATSTAAPYAGTPDASVLARFDDVMVAMGTPDAVILDARTPEEYAEGHIPGAVNLNFPLNAVAGSPKALKPADELRAMYDAIGVTPHRHIVPYCASGERAAVTAHVLHLLGYEDVSLYTGSWKEWSERPDAPIIVGNQP